MSLSVAAFGAQADLYEDGLMAYAVGNYVKAGQHFMSAADAGIVGAEHMLMRLFEENKLYARDIQAETLKWTRRAAEKGVVHAQLSLGKIYAEKQGDVKTAVEWYRKAAAQGHPDAYYQLGAVFAKGAKEVGANAQESRRLYQIAASEFDVFAQKGSADAQYKLAGMYRQGLGVKSDMVLTLKWMEKSALQGYALAQSSLGRLYAEGVDVPRDTRQARYWLSLAAAQGEQDAVVALNELKASEDRKVALVM
ncbi:MAG: sel1 repeat family protein [Gammaproteobacteria bacterium]|nr:sel1 repeat family protein [Gammaproteobacteria bacterium]